jgi:hypothetical protein
MKVPADKALWRSENHCEPPHSKVPALSLENILYRKVPCLTRGDLIYVARQYRHGMDRGNHLENGCADCVVTRVPQKILQKRPFSLQLW